MFKAPVIFYFEALNRDFASFNFSRNETLIDEIQQEEKKIYCSQITFCPRDEPRMKLGVHLFGIMWNYFEIH